MGQHTVVFNLHSSRLYEDFKGVCKDTYVYASEQLPGCRLVCVITNDKREHWFFETCHATPPKRPPCCSEATLDYCDVTLDF